MLSIGRAIIFAALVLAGVPGAAGAGPLYDFSTLAVGGKTTSLGADEKLGPITAQAFQRSWVSGAWKWETSTLTARDEDPADHGLGVCSEGSTTCHIGGTGAGDYSELSQRSKQEAILLSLDVGWDWTELWVSSLDGGGTGGTEKGKIYWGDTADIPTLLLGGATRSFSFKFGDLPGSKVEGDLLTLGALKSIFDQTSRHVLFVPDGKAPDKYGKGGDDSDYLVYGAGAKSTVPEPATILLLGVGLGGAAVTRHRRTRPLR